MIDPIKIDPEQLTGLEWNIDDLQENESSMLIPKKSFIYEGINGKQSLRITDFKETTSEENNEKNMEYNFMNLEPLEDEEDEIEPYYDIDTDYLKFEQEFINYTLFEYEEDITGFQTEESNKTIEQIIDRKFTEINIQEEVDDMIIECITELGMTYEESYKKLQEYYNLPLVEDISQGKTMISEFYKQEQVFMDQDMRDRKVRPRVEWSGDTSEVTSQETLGREPWAQPSISYTQESSVRGRGNRLPIGQIHSGNMLLLEKQKPQLWVDEVLTWEQMAVRMWETNKKDSMDMFSYLETTLGPIALGIWQSQKAQDSAEINNLKALGDNPYNFTSQIRTLILGVDPAKNNSLIQDTAIRNLEQLSIADMKYINEFTLDFTRLLSQTGKAMDDNLCNKYFIKLPGDLGKIIHESWRLAFGEKRNLGIGPRITYTFSILEDKCKEVALQEQLKRNAYAFCKTAIYTPQAYGFYDKKKHIRRSTTYNKNYKTNQNRSKYVKKPQTRTCRCFICGEEKHLANKCPNKNKNMERANLIEQLNDYEIEALKTDDSDNESIYSIYSEDEQPIAKVIYTYMNIEECEHIWIHKRGNNYIKCFKCGYYPSIEKRSQCNICFKEICCICLKNLFNMEIGTTSKIIEATSSTNSERLKNLELIVELHTLKIKELDSRMKELENIINTKEVNHMSTKVDQIRMRTQGTMNSISVQCRVWLDKEKFIDLTGIVDTGATKNTISYKLAPLEYHKKLPYEIVSRTIEDRFITITHCLEPVAIQFLDFTNNYSRKYQMPQININPQHIKSRDFMDRKRDKGKAKLIQPTQTSRISPMSISSEEEKTEKLMSQSIRAPSTQDLRKLPASIADLSSTTQFYNPSQSKIMDIRPPRNKQFTQRTSSHIQKTQNAVITFGNYALQRCDDPSTKFRPIMGIVMTEEQQCLLDNLWHIQTMPQASTFKVQVEILEAKNAQLLQKLEKRERKENTSLYINYDMFRTRILDTPWRRCLKPVIERFPEFKQIVSKKICSEFPLVLYELQQKLIDIAFGDTLNTRIRVVERTDDEGNGTGLLLLQVFPPTRFLSEDDIVQFYHHGMIDYMEFRLNSETERLLNRLGEKLPYLQAIKKKNFFDHKAASSDYLEKLAITTDINFANMPWLNMPQIDKELISYVPPKLHTNTLEKFIKKHQQTPELPDHFHWEQFRLLGEGHYIQIYAKQNWSMLLPFVGESDLLELKHIKDLEDEEDSDPGTPVSIDSTHRDF
ncbi:hypothetical protein QVD17_11803 [Tagetes erecta]|uniref:CCHC-type domain-containing protein n=1 Tax=Tagetes erecta TaxID=13708 RepID=A0AAD8P2C8_TARER|nr:hypothetical protein QVD17_11803 [Tagetes erecta]